MIIQMIFIASEPSLSYAHPAIMNHSNQRPHLTRGPTIDTDGDVPEVTNDDGW
jgi:hypothetical protein